LYDQDQRTLRHLTGDEISRLIVWALCSTAVLTGLLVPFQALNLKSNDRLLVWRAILVLAFLLRAAARALWRGVTPPKRRPAVGEGRLAAAFVRKLDLFPDIHAEIALEVENSRLLHDRLEELDVSLDRIVVACREFSEELLETLLPFCRLRGLKLTV